MNSILILVVSVSIPSSVLCRPEIPADRYGGPSPEYLPAVESVNEFAPMPPSRYGPPQPEYGPPQPEYGPPATLQKLITKNVYIHVPPPEPIENQPAQLLEVPIPKKHYKIIFIKAPTPPTPTVPVLPEQVPDEHKTLVYVLVKKPEPQPPIELPKVQATEPSKPEVYFIRYKEGEKLPQQYGPPRS